MKYLPYEHLTILKNLEKRELIKHLSASLESRNRIRFGKGPEEETPKDYEGFILGDTFSINRTATRSNLFRPVIQGFFHELDSSTKIEVNMKLPLGISAGIAFFLAVSGLLFLYLILSGIPNLEFEALLFIVPIATLFSLYLSCLYNFKADILRLENFFSEL